MHEYSDVRSVFFLLYQMLGITNGPHVAIAIVVIFHSGSLRFMSGQNARTGTLTGCSPRSDHNVAQLSEITRDIPRKGDVRKRGTEGSHRHGATNGDRFPA